MSPANYRALPLFALLVTSLLIPRTASAGDNVDVEIGLRKISDPCGLRGGQQLEFAITARNMVGVAQVAVSISWMPAGAVAEVGATPGPLPDDVGLIAPFSPLVIDDRAEFGMASLGSGVMDGDGELVTFRLELAPQFSGEDPVEVWVDSVSVGPSFTELDVIKPIQAVLLTNFCDEVDNPLEQVMLVSPEQINTSFSPLDSGARLDDSAGEIRVRARLLRRDNFATEEMIAWTVGNSGHFPLFVHADETVIVIDAGGVDSGITTLSDLRGDAFILLDIEGSLAGGLAVADITACTASPDRCAVTRMVWEVAATAVATTADALPTAFDLGANFPNPFNPSTTIPFSVPDGAGPTHLQIVNVRGQLVATLVQSPLTSGRHAVGWNGRTNDGRSAASGIYFLRLRHDVGQLVRPIVLAR